MPWNWEALRRRRRSVPASHRRILWLREPWRGGLRDAWPSALLLAVALGAVLWVGVNLSNAFPSAAKPFGWPGPAAFENGVAMVRPELLLAGSLPALWLGLRILAPDDRPTAPPAGTPGASPAIAPEAPAGPATAGQPSGPAVPWRTAGARLAVALGLAAVAVLLGAAYGRHAAAATPASAWRGFVVAHILLAWAWLAIGVLASALSRQGPRAAALGLGAWLASTAVAEGAIKWRLFRTVGYDGLSAGQFPSWFYLAQAANPDACYRAVLILWRPGFRDWTEHAALDHAVMPGWMTASAFAWAMLGLWVILPLAGAAMVLQGKAWLGQIRLARASARPAASGQAVAAAVDDE